MPLLLVSDQDCFNLSGESHECFCEGSPFVSNLVLGWINTIGYFQRYRWEEFFVHQDLQTKYAGKNIFHNAT